MKKSFPRTPRRTFEITIIAGDSSNIKTNRHFVGNYTKRHSCFYGIDQR
ncbi:hypothetical protein C7475_11157 [Chitinophaga sp. S165]|nr:hypothetical protein C7475_11157 [Chitinophaga sp. S165]